MSKRNEWVAAAHPCQYSSGIECEQQDRCNRCGWNPAVDAKRREQEPLWEVHWRNDDTLLTAPVRTERLVFRNDIND